MSDEPRESKAAEATEAPPASENATDTSGAPSTLLNGFIGGVVAVVLSFIPFSTVLGGGVAGYLEGGEYADGAKVGALAGLVAFVPFILIAGVALVFIPVLPIPDTGIHLALWVSVLVIAFFAAVYTVGFSVFGGVLGVYLKNEV